MECLVINIAGTDHTLKVNLSAKDAEELLGMMLTEFATVEEAVTEWGGIIPDMMEQINNVNNKKEVVVEVPKKTVGVVVVAGEYKFPVSKEWLLGTGAAQDAKLVRPGVYEMAFVDFIRRTSKPTADKAMEVLARHLHEGVVKPQVKPVVGSPKAKVWEFKKGGKPFAETYILGLLGDPMADTIGDKGKWLADFCQASVKEATVNNILMAVKDGTLWITFRRDYYKANTVACQKALTVIKNACRGSKLEYRPLVNGSLPIRKAGTWRTPEI